LILKMKMPSRKTASAESKDFRWGSIPRRAAAVRATMQVLARQITPRIVVPPNR
jgi:hypothetical protein